MAARADERTPLLAASVQETQITSEAPGPSTSDGRAGPSAPGRLITPDLLRGLLMVLMAIDHVNQGIRGFPHGTGSAGEAADFPVVRWTNDLGYTLRTLSHLCAPGFTMLLGMGLAFFIASRASITASRSEPWRAGQYVKHIVLRTVALVLANGVLTLFLTKYGYWFFNIVLLALAFDYLVVGLLAVGLLYLEPMLARLFAKLLPQSYSSRAIGFHAVNGLLLTLSAVTIWLTIWLDPKQGDCNHDAHLNTIASYPPLPTEAGWNIVTMDTLPSEQNCTRDPWRLTFNVLFRPTVCRGILSIFPPMAWLPFALYGLLYGRLLLARLQVAKLKSPAKQRSPAEVSLDVVLAVALSLLFVSTRVWSYGDLSTNCLRTSPVDSTTRRSQYLASAKAFFYIVKYPPSPAFAFFSLAGNHALSVVFSLCAAPTLSPAWLVHLLRSDANPLLVYGRQSLFFYIIHLTISSVAGPLVLKTRLAHVIPADRWDGKEEMIGVGLGAAFFTYYLALLSVMYVLCSAYGRFKVRQTPDSIWRFF